MRSIKKGNNGVLAKWKIHGTGKDGKQMQAVVKNTSAQFISGSGMLHLMKNGEHLKK